MEELKNNTLGGHYAHDIFKKLEKKVKPSSEFWARRGAALYISTPWTIDSTRQFFSDIYPATLQAAINNKQFDDELETAQSTFRLSEMMTQFANVINRSSINTGTWTQLKSKLQKCHNYLEEHFKAKQLTVDTQLMIQNFVELAQELLEPYPGITIGKKHVVISANCCDNRKSDEVPTREPASEPSNNKIIQKMHTAEDNH
uniref:Uncharacterized protein n=1 Tax=Glossina austeni TaxID=7395 RepID=A0A1A9VEJ6_GLOAU